MTTNPRTTLQLKTLLLTKTLSRKPSLYQNPLRLSKNLNSKPIPNPYPNSSPLLQSATRSNQPLFVSQKNQTATTTVTNPLPLRIVTHWQKNSRRSN